MNLLQKFLLLTGALVASVITLGGISIWNLAAQARAMHAASAEYDVTERAAALAVQVGWFRDSLRSANARAFHDAKFLDPIRAEVPHIQQQVQVATAVDDGDAGRELELAQAIPAEVDKALAQLKDGATSSAEVAATLDRVHQGLTMLARLAPEAARRHVTAVAALTYTRLMWAVAWLLLVLTASVLMHYKQYRLLVKPLLWLRDDMRHSAAAEYRVPVQTRGDQEFREVAVYFNGLARELAELYRGLEEKVIARSRELVRSERLASVGFLAAGVAHEINNPLSVISGYAELAGKNVDKVLTLADSANVANTAEAEADALLSVMQAQEIIREEAFRCKEITSRLLSLARGGSDNRESLSLRHVAEQVALLVKGLKNYRGRSVVAEFAADDSLEVVGNATELKQVMLNLVVNALEAVPAETGIVRIGGERFGEWVEVSVTDNGKGMSVEVLEQIFEPFFTAKRGAGEPGTGLGLSITHAIVENHGGRIRAESEGVGRGSRFTFRLPAEKKSGTKAARQTVVLG